MTSRITVTELIKKYHSLIKENEELVQEIRNLRCTMIEAANHVNIIEEPLLFKRLISDSTEFITYEKNPYPEHDDIISEQYLKFLSKTL